MNADKNLVLSAFIRVPPRPIKMRHADFAVKRKLAPVPVDQNVAVPLVNPAMRHPAGIPLWTLFPPSLVPGVSVAIPTLVSGNPHMVTAGSPPALLDMNPGWRDANHNLGGRRPQGQGTNKDQSHQSFKNHITISFYAIHRATALLSKTFQRAPAGCMGRKGGPNGQPSMEHAEGHLARLKAPCTLEREGALARTQ